MTGSRLRLASVLTAFFMIALAPAVRAQFGVSLSLNKETYLTYEGVEATVTIVNRSGADVVMGGPNDTAWLSFDITDPQGRSVPPMGFRSEDNLVFKAGSTISRKVVISSHFSFSEYGTYGIIANVYHPPTQQYYTSARARANFTDAKPFWSPSFGVPPGLPGAGQVRRYELSVLRDLEHTNLYVRVVEDKTNLKIATFTLGTCIMVNDPQVTLDKDNKMHVLFMAAPHIYAHVCVDTQGHVAKRLYYKEAGTNRPRLVVDTTGGIAVQGGETYDPTTPTVTRPAGRSVGQKPPGL